VSSCSQSAFELRYPDIATCRSLIAQNCVNEINAPSSNAVPAVFEACSMLLPGPTWACNDFLYQLNRPLACTQAAGILPNGAPCGFNNQCSTGYCQIVSGDMCGVCASPPSVGASCAQLTSCGGSGVTCDQDACAVFAGQGQPCTTECVIGQACVGGTCQPQAESLGAACSFSGPGCDFYSGLTCDNNTMKCIAAVFAGPNQTCAGVTGVEVHCSGGALCTDDSCTPVSPVGQPCDLVQGPVCIRPSVCITMADGGTAGTCMIPDASTCQ
jgi:hypothetical protein